MNELYLEEFQYKNYDSLPKLREDIKQFDNKRAKDLVSQRLKEKRKAPIALLQSEAETQPEKKARIKPSESSETAN